MYAFFRRGLGQSEVEMLADPDWEMIKRRACKKWGVEELFDKGDAWSKLWEGRTLLVDDGNEVSLFCAWDQGDGEDVELFTGDIADICLEVNEWKAVD